MESLSPERPKPKWYFQSSFLLITFLFVGPLVLPLIWLHPTFSLNKKIILSALILGVSYLVGIALVKSLESINAYYSLAFP